MGIKLGYYMFALFIAGLVCLIAFICKILFANVNRQYKLLDEKESRLLQLYQTVESIIEEFNDQVKAAMEEIREHESKAAMIVSSLSTAPSEPVNNEQTQAVRPPRAERVDSSRLRAANEALARAERIVMSDSPRNTAVTSKSDNGAVFQRFFDETVSQPQTVAAAETTLNMQARSDAILALANEGKTDAQIASELGITRNEVKLIIGLTGKK